MCVCECKKSLMVFSCELDSIEYVLFVARSLIKMHSMTHGTMC